MSSMESLFYDFKYISGGRSYVVATLIENKFRVDLASLNFPVEKATVSEFTGKHAVTNSDKDRQMNGRHMEIAKN